MKSTRSTLIAALLVTGSAAQLAAQTRQRDLSRVSIEDLMKIEITSAAKKEQRAEDVPAAVFVITQDDIQRSGIRSLPELFRLVPGMEVAQVNSNKWAVSARGFNGLFSNKLLVLVDGRSIYSHSTSGVPWAGEDLLLQDIDHIEVIRGAGGTVWGANAMNGVINIITKSAQDTRGTSFAVGGGTFERDQASIRHGGSLGGLAYRVYSQWSDQSDSQARTGGSADDRWNSLTTGARADWTRGGDAVMAQGSFTTGQSRPLWRALSSFSPAAAPSPAGVSDVHSGTVMGRWSHTRSGGSSFQVQAFRTTRLRDEVTLWSTENIHDIELQYRTAFGGRHDLVVGSGYRDDNFLARPTFTMDIASSNEHVFNVFGQDEITLGRRVKVTVGSKLEHDNVEGWGALPSARVLWNVTPTTTRAWAAVARARRTPSAAELGVRLYLVTAPGAGGVPRVFGVVGNPDFQTEQLTQIEGGYRIQIGSSVALDVAVFRGSYDHLATLEPSAPAFTPLPEPHLLVVTQYANLLNVNTAGFEIAGHWVPATWWRLDGSYSGLHVAPRADPASKDPAAAGFDGNAPQHQWQLHSSLWPSARTEFDASLYHVGRLRQMDAEAYTRADARVEFKINNRLSAVATGQNLFDPAHAEFPATTLPLVNTAVPRSGKVSLSWKF